MNNSLLKEKSNLELLNPKPRVNFLSGLDKEGEEEEEMRWGDQEAGDDCRLLFEHVRAE